MCAQLLHVCVFVCICMSVCMCACMCRCWLLCWRTICKHSYVSLCLYMQDDQDDKCLRAKFVHVCKSPYACQTALLHDICPVYQHHCSWSLSRVEFTAIAATAKVNLGQVRAYALQMWRVCRGSGLSFSCSSFPATNLTCRGFPTSVPHLFWSMLWPRQPSSRCWINTLGVMATLGLLKLLPRCMGNCRDEKSTPWQRYMRDVATSLLWCDWGPSHLVRIAS